MKIISTDTPSLPFFMNHGMWNLFRLDRNGTMIQSFTELDGKSRKEFLQEAVRGFYPISYASLLAFKRSYELAENSVVKDIAYKLYLTEKGDMPLLPGSEFSSIRHCDQLKLMFESLIDEEFDIEEPERFIVIQKADIDNAGLLKAIAICDVIENTAPWVIHFYQELLIQCQVALEVPNYRIRRNYLDEHNLTEGSNSEFQHIEMLHKMLGKLGDVESSEAYKMEQSAFCGLVSDHFEKSRNNMIKILSNAKVT